MLILALFLTVIYCMNMTIESNCCSATVEPDDLWETMSRFSNFHLDTAVVLPLFRDFRRINEKLIDMRHDCLVGELVLGLLSLIATDYDIGIEKAEQEWFRLKDLRLKMTENHWDERSTCMKRESWDFAGIDRFMKIVGNFYFEKPEIQPNCSGLKIYFYSLPNFAPGRRTPLDASDPSYLPAFKDGPPLDCIFGMYGTEVVIPLSIKKKFPGCVVTDPNEADLFFVPSYFKCLDQLGWVDHFGQDNQSGANQLLNEVLDHVKQKPFWKKRNGADHVILWSWGRYPCAIPRWNDGRLGDAIFIQVENFCHDINSLEPMMASYSTWKDVMIPGLVDLWRIDEMKSFAKPIGHYRDILINFHGRSGITSESYKKAFARTRFVNALKDLPGVSIGGFISNYAEIMGRSRFCLAMRGITPWTIHLYVAMFSGCIPIVISDDLVYPFTDQVDFESFVIRFPEDGDPLELHTLLSNMSLEDLTERQMAMSKSACWFDYWNTDDHCNAMNAIFAALAKKVKILQML